MKQGNVIYFFTGVMLLCISVLYLIFSFTRSELVVHVPGCEEAQITTLSAVSDGTALFGGTVHAPAPALGTVKGFSWRKGLNNKILNHFISCFSVYIPGIFSKQKPGSIHIVSDQLNQLLAICVLRI